MTEPEDGGALEMFGDADADAEACAGDSCTIPEAPAEEI